MQKFIWLPIIFLLASCATQQTRMLWRVKDSVLDPGPAVELVSPTQQPMLTVPTRVLQDMLLAHLRISRTANVQSELYISDGDKPNAFAGPDHDGRFIVGINIPMVLLIGNDANEYAALIGHEVAHLAKGHIDSGQFRSGATGMLGHVVGAGLSMAGVPAAGLIAGLGAQLVDAAYSRDQEREADALGIEYMMANGYDPTAAIRLHRKFLEQNERAGLPFLSSHPSGEERIGNFTALIEKSKGAKQDRAAAPLPIAPID